MSEEHMEEQDKMTESVERESKNEFGAEVSESGEPGDEAPAAADDQDSGPGLTAAELPDQELLSIIKVLLLVSDRPLSISRMQEVLEGPSTEKIEQIIGQIQQRLAEHEFPFQVREVAGGYVLSTLPKYAGWVQKFYSPKIKASRLSQAALETLSVVAYKQPVTRTEIETIRGVNVDSTLRTLLDKRLVEIVGYKDVIGKPATYGTSDEFLLRFGLKALSDLPSADEIRRLNSDK